MPTVNRRNYKLFSVVFCGVAAHHPGSSPTPFPSLFSTVSTLGQVLVPLTAWGLVAGLPGFASHGISFHSRAGCQWWKLLDVSGTPPPF